MAASYINVRDLAAQDMPTDLHENDEVMDLGTPELGIGIVSCIDDDNGRVEAEFPEGGLHTFPILYCRRIER